MSQYASVREIDVTILRDAVASLLAEANYQIPDDILEGLRRAEVVEESELGRQTLTKLIRNYELGAVERLPVCQDSGMTVIQLEMGQDVHWVGGSVQDAISEGIRAGTRSGYLRWSLVADPLRHGYAEDSQAGVIHIDLIEGATVRLTLASKGFGGENMSALRMLTPADGIDALKQFVLDTVDHAGANACPPVIVGVGVGGTFEFAAWLAKKAVLRPITVRHAREDIRALEEELLEAVNRLGIGPQGFGGLVTALAVNIEVHPTHIASLPVAVNLGCHSNRRITVDL